ncbi:MAG: reprolysin-like metallopeptidase, partial [Cocleimonas sp.]
MKKLILTLSILSCFNAVADSNENSVWQDFGQNEKNISSILSDSPLSTLSSEGAMKQRRLILDESLLKNQLSQLDSFIVSGKAAKATISSPLTSEISLPLPDGSMLRVHATPSLVISAEAAEAHPELKTWSVRGIDDPDISGVIDFTANGFHGMLLMPDGDTIFIDPDKKQSGDVYNSFSKQENTNAFNVALNCGTHEDHDHQSHITDPEFAIKAAAKELPVSNFPDVSISRIKTYRLAMSATAEYTLEQGGTAGAFSAMMTSINRINPLFERDLGIKLELLDLPELIFVDADSDPFSQPNNPSALMIANGQYLSGQDLGQDIVRNRLNDFDIGHVLSHRTDIRGGSGVAYLGVVCEDQGGGIAGIKAAGATTSSNPDGETFDLVLLAHELGHQLGGNHTFNSVSSNNCANGRSGSVAVEPGSGSSIMAYGGLCSSSDNLIENPRDDFFHFAS